MLNHDIQQNDIMQNDTQHEWLICDTRHDCHYAERYYAECRNLLIAILNVIMVSVILLNVVMLSVAAVLNQPKVVLTKCCVDQMLC